MIYMISYNIGPRYNSTWLYLNITEWVIEIVSVQDDELHEFISHLNIQ